MDPGTWHFEATAAGPGWVVGGARVGRNSRVSLESGLDAMCDPPTPPVPLLPHYGPSSRPSRRAGPRRRRSSVSSKTVRVAVPRHVTKCQINKKWPRRSRMIAAVAVPRVDEAIAVLSAKSRHVALRHRITGPRLGVKNISKCARRRCYDSRNELAVGPSA